MRLDLLDPSGSFSIEIFDLGLGIFVRTARFRHRKVMYTDNRRFQINRQDQVHATNLCISQRWSGQDHLHSLYTRDSLSPMESDNTRCKLHCMSS
jgi:hypothetical protein